MCNNLKARYCLNIERDPIHRRYTALHHVTRSKGEPQVCRSDSGGDLMGCAHRRRLLQRGTKQVLSICAFIDACCPPWLTWFAGTMHFKYCVDSNWRNSAVGTGYLRFSYWSSHATATPHRYRRRKTQALCKEGPQRNRMQPCFRTRSSRL